MSDTMAQRVHSPSTEGGDFEPRVAKDSEPLSEEDQKKQEDADAKLAERLSMIIEAANERVVPLVQMVRKKIDAFEGKNPDDRNEEELVKEVKPLLEEAEKVLNETNGAIRGADHDQQLTKEAKRRFDEHKASPQEQRLAQALKVMVEEVQGTIDWAKEKLESYPKAKKDLGPLLTALGQPLTQIVGGVGFLLAGVLGLLSNLLSGLGLNGILTGLFAATGLHRSTRAWASTDGST
ncbi:hypothetical protein BKA70DRAFT_352555 [Coprinopsis sp. MPI-PUGE-AT-0042]|nr:hypothetical protein BKA70DRAFT_352555 [Coprinopsis sp. MPI-PUGE-AT-0042]